MTESEAISRLMTSFGDEPQLITPKGKTYEEYVEQCKSDLLGYLIKPIEVQVTSACFPEYDLQKYQEDTVWAIARSKNNWLLTLDTQAEFALAFGESTDSLQMLGFSSSDALAEWLG
ncbi:hypothetical protein [Ferrimonas balearica]|uniref:hypothetical protein n=1 Tax=Ferrimonas balearica TaxID=44012 RepID=UPI001C98FAA0|nr:hypothetical protein [Ferrimonas balearica]MBY5991738.1 hypothetical protein [Ferrimonas balearica]